jgi:hypothetical protein
VCVCVCVFFFFIQQMNTYRGTSQGCVVIFVGVKAMRIPVTVIVNYWLCLQHCRNCVVTCLL